MFIENIFINCCGFLGGIVVGVVMVGVVVGLFLIFGFVKVVVLMVGVVVFGVLCYKVGNFEIIVLLDGYLDVMFEVVVGYEEVEG